jgi:hypothetical protein
MGYLGEGNQKMRRRSWLTGAAMLVFAGSAPAFAGTILSPIDSDGNTLGSVGGGSPANLINQSGLSQNFISGVTDFETYISLGPTSASVTASTGWVSAAGSLGGYLQFDLGATYALSGFVLWNQNNDLAVNGFTLIVASNAAFTSGVTNLGTFNAAEGLNAQTYTLTGEGEFVRMQINSTHGPNQAILGEIAFDATLIPEPCSLLVLGMGWAGIGFARRRRR